MKRMLLIILVTTVMIGGTFIGETAAQVNLPKVTLFIDKPIYNTGEPIRAVITLKNFGDDIITSKGFKSMPFHLFLNFYNLDNQLITSHLLKDSVGFDPPPPPQFTCNGQNVPGEPIEIVESGWLWSVTIPNVHNYYTLTKYGQYSVRAKIPMRTYSTYCPDPGPPETDFAPIDSQIWQGALESNIVNFTLLTPAAVDHIAINPSSSSIIVGGSQSYTATSYDQNNNSLGDVTPDTTFSISPDGSCTGNTCTAGAAGLHDVLATYSGKTATASLQVNAGGLDHITISPTSATIAAGGSQVYMATGYDQYNNSLGNVTGATTFTITPEGSCTGAACTATIPGPHTVTGNDGGKTATASLQVNAGGLHHIAISPASATIIAGGSQSYTAQGFDANNNSLGDVTAATAFSISPDGSCTGNTCTATVGGAHTVTGNDGGKTATASLQVNAGGLDHITISPASATITTGGSQVYTATGYDQYNNSLGNVTGATTFTIAPDGSCTGATCTATIPGPHTVTGNDSGKTATASLQLNAGGLDHITISPASATIIAGGSQSYTAQGFDANNNSVGDVTAATAFSISPNGTCTGNTCTATVVGAHTVTGNDSGKTATASLQVNYNYAGFFSPVDNPSAVNTANSGQAITVKWRLTDANGVGISDTGSFISLTSYQVSCTDWASNPGPAIKESAAGASGLQYLGSGNWQYNWKTSKGYAGTCRVMVLTLKDGTQYTADFKFK